MNLENLRNQVIEQLPLELPVMGYTSGDDTIPLYQNDIQLAQSLGIPLAVQDRNCDYHGSHKGMYGFHIVHPDSSLSQQDLVIFHPKLTQAQTQIFQELMEQAKEKNHVPLYPYSHGEAVRLGEVDQYKLSLRENILCSESICKTIGDNYDNNCMGKDLARDVMEKHGIDRTAYVLANTIKHYDYDGRISRDNKEWAKTIFVPEDENSSMFLVEGGVHIGLVDLFVGQYRQSFRELNLWDKSQVNSPDGIDFKHKVMVLKPSELKDQYKTRDQQLFYATGGFGCSPERGGKVMGVYLADGQRDYWYRHHFLGEAKAELLPDWAKAKVTEHNPPQTTQEKQSVMEKLQVKTTPRQATTSKPKEVER